ncbi:MarR family transcriptional regulator [Tianweitania sp. BSSL-BM11]|uniref:MarR family transcriptional regulator n=2 Tax=Tianweitania aestuarii TaxID=2814886 RepID=A0ABS5RXS6_9HYPH|nr:MarR family transcriptional regulator [Tianweitania aestuarii]
MHKRVPEGESGIDHAPVDLDDYLPYLLNRLANRWNLDQNRDLSAFNINNTVLRTLSVLHVHKTLTVNEIAAYAVVEQSNASRTIETMVTAGLVERQIAASDLRRREVALTREGEALLQQVWPTIARNHDRLVDGIPDADMQACLRTIRAMIRNIGGDAV